MKCPECGAELIQSCCANIYHDCMDCGYRLPNQHPCHAEIQLPAEPDEEVSK